MKKILILLMTVAAFSFNTQAQMWLTLKGGGGIAVANGSDGAQAGISVLSGVGYKHQIYKKISLEGDILLDTRAVSYLTGSADAEDFFVGGGTYIQVPVTAQYMIPFRKRELAPYRVGQPDGYLFLEAGPYFSYGTSVSVYIDQTIIASAESQDDPITEANQKGNAIDIGITTGLGFNFGINGGKNRLILGTRTNYGFIDAYKDARLGSATNLSVVGYLALDFSLTKRKHIKHRW